MLIHGLQKMTLLDFPGKVACTVFLGGCDFRCPFCHNSDLLDMNAEPVMDDTELLSFLNGRKGLLDGVAFTGGEPLLRPDIADLFRKVKALGYAVKLDTNGTHPDVLLSLIREGLVDYVAMDVKNARERYAETVGRTRPGDSFEDSMTRIEKSIAVLLKGLVPYEFRTTVVKEFHDDDSFHGIAEMIKGADRYFLQCFTDRDSVLQGGLSAPSRDEMERYADIVRPFVRDVQIRGMD